MLLLEPSLLSLVEQLLKCGRYRGLVLPMSMMECFATEKRKFFKTFRAFESFRKLTELFGIAFVHDAEHVVARHFVVVL